MSDDFDKRQAMILKARIFIFMAERPDETFTISEIARNFKRRAYTQVRVGDAILDLIEEGLVDTVPREAVQIGRPTMRFFYAG